jgi:uncharacterized protein (TIGR02145 family)
MKKVYLFTLSITALVLSFIGCITKQTAETVKDIDGNIYNTVTIGNQVWMQENLKTTRYNDGTPIPNVTDITEWRHCDSPAFVWYDNDISYKEQYGALYNWHAVGDRPGLCPEGWHVPSDEEWKQLEMYLGMTKEQADGTVWRGTNEGGKMKEAGTEHWTNPNKGATNESGLTIIGSGRRFTNGLFGTINEGCTLWSSTESSLSSATYRHFATGNSGIGRNPAGEKKFGFTVRCVKNN